MGYNQENYRRVRQAYQTKFLKAEEAADRRRDELHALSPALANIDRQLSATGVEIALAAIGAGERWKENLAAVEAKNLRLQAERRALIESLGYPADYTDPHYDCPRCRDTGFVDAKMCGCMRRDLILAGYESSGLGNLMRTQTFESFDLSYYQEQNGDRAKMSRNLELLRRYAEDFGKVSPNLLLVGDTGLGKTHLSTALARRIIDRGFDVYYTSAVGMFADFESVRFGQSTEEAAENPRRYTTCDLLILDDLGTEMTNQFTNSCLYTVLNNRINLNRATIISTNLTAKELRERYSDRITSRLIGEFLTMRFYGTDVRRQKLGY